MYAIYNPYNAYQYKKSYDTLDQALSVIKQYLEGWFPDTYIIVDTEDSHIKEETDVFNHAYKIYRYRVLYWCDKHGITESKNWYYNAGSSKAR